jgi:pyruvate formate lyase activating enzyme
MDLYGLQKLTLLDYPGRTACTVFLAGCNLRCPFCHNFEMTPADAASQIPGETFFSFLNKRKGLLDGVVVTGGEPCMRPDLADFLKEVKDLGFQVKLDTNGFFPARLREVLQKGLADYVAMDIKNSPEKYAATVGLPDAELRLDAVKESISVIMNSSADYEFRTTIMREWHEESDIRAIGEMIRGAKRYCLQPFVDRETVPDHELHAPAEDVILAYAGIMRSYVSDVSVRGVDLAI